ncbi:hypothetical protein GUJ93_ZPchr0006g41318 [Zizania palustris]|uniref:Uncharacterized protein n=1 Tax=Zizania palustris TaxID=103762 RepID=A0A8J5SJE2_ZIZPA|nr:hypothetical protein GUJ93_ZPchr0006g41318 [Zizania palustris]
MGVWCPRPSQASSSPQAQLGLGVRACGGHGLLLAMASCPLSSSLLPFPPPSATFPRSRFAWRGRADGATTGRFMACSWPPPDVVSLEGGGRTASSSPLW